jgi:hypothetical protein
VWINSLLKLPLDLSLGLENQVSSTEEEIIFYVDNVFWVVLARTKSDHMSSYYPSQTLLFYLKKV